MNKKLEKIVKKYEALKESDYSNYCVGGGLSESGKFASRRHEDAKNDCSKLTEGEAVKLFKNATNCEIDFARTIINFAVPNMEWHHAGKLPKQYGGGMKKLIL